MLQNPLASQELVIPNSLAEKVAAPDITQELREIFLADVKNIFKRIEIHLREWNAFPTEYLFPNQIAAALHTLTGTALLSGIKPIAIVSHVWETLLNSLTPKLLHLYPETISLSQQVLDYLLEQATKIENKEPLTFPKVILEKLEPIQSQLPLSIQLHPTAGYTEPLALLPAQHTEQAPPLTTDTCTLNYITKQFCVLDLYRARLELHNCNLGVKLAELNHAITSLQTQIGDSTAIIKELLNIRFPLEKQGNEVKVLLEQQKRISQNLQDTLQQAYISPFHKLLPQLSNIVHTHAETVGKNVEFIAVGAECELDREMLRSLGSILEEVLDIAVHQGIESLEQRRAAGKASVGLLTISITADGDAIIVTITDDGSGFNPHDLTTEYNWNGITITEQISALGGSIQISSQPGKGTSYLLRVPSKLATKQAISIRINQEVLAIPLSPSIDGIVNISKEELHQCYSGEQPDFYYAGYPYYVAHLGTLLRVPSTLPYCESSYLPHLLLSFGERRMALQVDEVVGYERIVMNCMPGPTIERWFSRGTTMLNGKESLVLDIASLGNVGIEKLIQAIRTSKQIQRPILALIADDSISSRHRLSRILHNHCIDVITAKNGEIAWVILQEQQPDIILLDYMMPLLDGCELAARIQASSEARLSNIPIIMFGGGRCRDTEQANKLQSLGIKRYIPKICSDDYLLDSIYEFI